MNNHYPPLRYIVPPLPTDGNDSNMENIGILLQTVLRQRMKLSRRLIVRLKSVPYGITVNGVPAYTNARVLPGDLVEVRMPLEQSDHILPQEIPFEIIHEDDHLLIVNKAAGMIVHPTHGHYMNTLANGIVHYWLERGELHRFRPIHRLDQDTSGVLAIAKNPYVHQQISEQMKAKRVHKEYIAVVSGSLADERGTIHAPIDRSSADPHIRVVIADGYPATTHYEVVSRLPGATLVRIWLETGRTHQIRVHMQYLGHPLIGDKLYGDQPGCLLPEDIHPPSMGRQALHALCLGFTHPATGQEVRYTAALPADMQQLITELERREMK